MAKRTQSVGNEAEQEDQDQGGQEYGEDQTQGAQTPETGKPAKASKVKMDGTSRAAAIRAAAKAQGRELTGEEIRDIIESKPKHTIMIPGKASAKESEYVKLATINGVVFWGKRGTQMEVSRSVARIALNAGIIQSCVPWIEKRVLKEIAPAPSIALHPEK